MRARPLLLVLTACGPVVGASDDDTSTGRTTSSGPVSTVGVTTADPSVDPTTVEPTRPDDATMDIKIDMTGGGDDCVRTFAVEPLPSDVVVLVDASQTMAQPVVDHDLDPDTPPVTRWSMLATALEQYLPMLVERSTVEMWAFPRFDAEAPPQLSACEIEAVSPGLTSCSASGFASATIARYSSRRATSSSSASKTAVARNRSAKRIDGVATGRRRTRDYPRNAAI